ncbi:ACP S-malonyltransferase [uncultured Porphyromonas sp.]|uniref:ACP S-malonyltransferase n=1 Tax=uncultured Porphyromonas sp. TaxID=159274 RepID=UPI0025E2676E|nr:ACP S-malonyltransferase [uncultured Porphyromonas sp.]
MLAYVFPGQGSQHIGMGMAMYDNNPEAMRLFDRADEILGFGLSKIIFDGTEEELKQTAVTQPAVFVHSYISAAVLGSEEKPDMVAGHSLGEFTALAVAGALSFEDAVRLVHMRAVAMQKACAEAPSTMAAIIGLPDAEVEEICANILDKLVIPANYNSPGQVVISGSIDGVNQAIEEAKKAGAKRAIALKVSGAFHSPLMEPARQELEQAIHQTHIQTPRCPIYQNVDAKPHTDPKEIESNLVKQLTAPVLWSQTVQRMIADGADRFIEFGPGNTLQGLIRRIDRSVTVEGREG